MTIDDGPPYVIGRDFYLGERIDLTRCDCPDCVEFRGKLSDMIRS